MKLTEEMIRIAQEYANEQRTGISIINDCEFNTVAYNRIDNTSERLVGNRCLATIYPEPIVVKSKPSYEELYEENRILALNNKTARDAFKNLIDKLSRWWEEFDNEASDVRLDGGPSRRVGFSVYIYSEEAMSELRRKFDDLNTDEPNEESVKTDYFKKFIEESE